MELTFTTDIALKGKEWDAAIENFAEIFKPRVNYNIFMLSLSIGVMYDRRIEKLEESSGEYRTVPRTVIQHYEKGQLETIFQAAILTTTTEDFPEERRLELAFGNAEDFNRLNFLIQFANFGVTKLAALIGSTDEESMENIKTFLVRTVEGSNLDLDELSDDFLMDDDEELTRNT